VIPKSPVSLVAPVFIKGSAATIYELINGAKITMQTFLEMQQLANSNSPTWLTLNDAYTVSIPNAPTS
jgi:plasmid maintenance system antidote protein VapI